MEIVERLVNDYGNDVLRLATSILGSRDVAEDVHQETFLRVCKSWDSFRGDANEKTWIIGIAVNVCRDMMRSAYKRRVTVSDEIIATMSDSSSVQEMDNRVEHNEMIEALQKLSHDHREAIILFYYQDLDVHQIANIQKIPEGTVKSRLHKARGNLAKILGGELHGK